MHKVLVTGSSGAVGGAAVRALLARGHYVRGLDLHPTPNLADMRLGDIKDAAIVNNALAGVDTVIHLAGITDDDDFISKLLPTNIAAVYQLLHAAVHARVKRVVLASTIQIIDGMWRNGLHGLIPPTAAMPTNGYAVTKLFSENIGHVFAAEHGLSVIAARIGFLPRTPRSARSFIRKPYLQNIYLSHDDCGRFFTCAVEAPNVPYAVLWVLSRRHEIDGPDLAPSRDIIGYEPQDLFPQGLPWPIEGA